MIKTKQKLISLEDISLLTGYSVSYILSIIERYSVPCKSHRGKIYVRKEWLDEFLTKYTFNAFLKREHHLPLLNKSLQFKKEKSTLHTNINNIKKVLKHIGPNDSYLDDDLTASWQQEFWRHHKKIQSDFNQKAKQEKQKRQLALYTKMSYEPIPLRRHHRSIILYKKPSLPTKINKVTAIVLAIIVLMMVLGSSYQFIYEFLLPQNLSYHQLQYPKPTSKTLSRYIILNKDKFTKDIIFVSPDDLFGGKVAGISEVNKDIVQRGCFKKKSALEKIIDKINEYLKFLSNE